MMKLLVEYYPAICAVGAVMSLYTMTHTSHTGVCAIEALVSIVFLSEVLPLFYKGSLK